MKHRPGTRSSHIRCTHAMMRCTRLPLKRTLQRRLDRGLQPGPIRPDANFEGTNKVSSFRIAPIASRRQEPKTRSEQDMKWGRPISAQTGCPSRRDLYYPRSTGPGVHVEVGVGPPGCSGRVS
ncbi:hypothetical protein C8Q80DRAFT_880789 [Daedaleopsis nitida]|nr:hypothetical protein C8Q80DRAFT_880789 [Daedaleopsis nitida]